jgi:hypothetical protein
MELIEAPLSFIKYPATPGGRRAQPACPDQLVEQFRSVGDSGTDYMP